MGKLGWQPRSALLEPREADAVGMGARAAFEPCIAGRPGNSRERIVVTLLSALLHLRAEAGN